MTSRAPTWMTCALAASLVAWSCGGDEDRPTASSSLSASGGAGVGGGAQGGGSDGGAAGEGGMGQGGVGAVGGMGGASASAHAAADLVSGGVTCSSASWSVVGSMGQSPGGNGKISSRSFTFVGGVVGATQ